MIADYNKPFTLANFKDSIKTFHNIAISPERSSLKNFKMKTRENIKLPP